MPGNRIAEAARWYRQAGADLDAARWNHSGKFYSTACFLAQQAGEKALKSVLYHIGARREALLTHSLVAMVEVVGQALPGAADLLTAARTLDLHYIPSRYPNGLPSGYPHQFYDQSMADQAVQCGERILGAVEGYFRREDAHEILGQQG